MSYKPTDTEIRNFIKQKEDEMGGFAISRANAIVALQNLKKAQSTVSLTPHPPHSLQNVIGFLNAGTPESELLSKKIPVGLIKKARNNIQKRDQERSAKIRVRSNTPNPFAPRPVAPTLARSVARSVAPSFARSVAPALAQSPGGDISTIESLNAWILAETHVNMTGPDIMVSREDPKVPGGIELLGNRFLLEAPRLLRTGLIKLNPGQTLEQYREDTSFLTNEYHMIYNSGGGKNDCLIISFLMAVSPAYRKLEYDEKYRISNTFRRQIFPTLIQQSKIPEIVSKLKNDRTLIPMLAHATATLSDSHITCLAFMYKINILSLETGKSSGAKGEPPKVTFIESHKPPAFPTGIIICNRGNGHYEIVVEKKTNKYIFTEPELRIINNRVQDRNPFDGGKVTGLETKGQIENAAIPFNAGDYVIFAGERYIIIERDLDTNSGNIKLRALWITKDLKDKTLANKMNDTGLTRLRKDVGVPQILGNKEVIYVTPNRVEKIRNGGRQHKTRKALKTRKLFRNRR